MLLDCTLTDFELSCYISVFSFGEETLGYYKLSPFGQFLESFLYFLYLLLPKVEEISSLLHQLLIDREVVIGVIVMSCVASQLVYALVVDGAKEEGFPLDLFDIFVIFPQYGKRLTDEVTTILFVSQYLESVRVYVRVLFFEQFLECGVDHFNSIGLVGLLRISNAKIQINMQKATQFP